MPLTFYFSLTSFFSSLSVNKKTDTLLQTVRFEIVLGRMTRNFMVLCRPHQQPLLPE